MGGALVYLCRRCKKEDRSLHVPDAMSAAICLANGYALPKEWGGPTPRLTDVHNCKDGHLGITDLIGVENDKKQ